MSKTVRLSTFQIGSPARPGEGLRIAVTRRPPRGVPKAEWKRLGWFDVWMPAVAPSLELLARFHPQGIKDDALWQKFLDAYEKELEANAEKRQTVELIAQVAARIPVSIGCFCGDETHCHRSRLREVLLRTSALSQDPE